LGNPRDLTGYLGAGVTATGVVGFTIVTTGGVAAELVGAATTGAVGFTEITLVGTAGFAGETFIGMSIGMEGTGGGTIHG
jgi:hypothetical protein